MVLLTGTARTGMAATFLKAGRTAIMIASALMPHDGRACVSAFLLAPRFSSIL